MAPTSPPDQHQEKGSSRGPGRLISVGKAAKATGISADTLRVWERRYPKLRPLRLPSGHRRYTAEQVRWLRLIGEAMDHGHRPAALLAKSATELTRLLKEPRSAQPARAAASRDTARLIELGASFRGREFRKALHDARRGLDVHGFLSRRVGPLLVGMGERWERGKLDICGEHYISELVEDYLRKLRGTVAVNESAPWIILATLPGERHVLGLHMAAVLCAREGMNVHFLGREAPVEHIVLAARKTGARAVGVSVSLATGGIETDHALADLRRDLSARATILVGGRGAKRFRRGVKGVEYVDDLEGLRGKIAALRGDSGENLAAGPRVDS